MMNKERIAIFVAAGLSSLLIAVGLFAHYDFTHNSRSRWTPETLDAQIAFKGAIGEAIFSSERPEIVPEVHVEGTGGLDALLAPAPDGNKNQGQIKAYGKDPQRFKRYAEMFDTAMNAKQVGDMLIR
jgi:hypothetical protein